MLCYFTGVSIKKRRCETSSKGRNLSSPQTLRWKSGGSTQWNAIGGRHFHLTRCWSVENRNEDTGFWTFLISRKWKTWMVFFMVHLGGRWSDHWDLTVIPSERVSVEAVDSVLKYLKCYVSGWAMICAISALGLIRFVGKDDLCNPLLCFVYWWLQTPKTDITPWQVSHPKREAIVFLTIHFQARKTASCEF